MKEALIIIAVVFVLAFVVTVAGILIGGQLTLSGANAGILKTDDAGLTWRLAGETSKMDISVIKLDKDDPSIMYVGTRRNGIWTGSEFGNKWQQTSEAGSRVFDIVELDALRNVLLAAVFRDSRGRVVRVADDEVKELYFTPLAKYAIFGARVHPNNSDTMWIISSDGGFYESVDAGNSWKAITRFDEGLLSLADDPRNPGRLWVVTSRGKVYGTRNAGRSWQDLSIGYAKFSNADEIETLVFDKNSDALYLGTKYGLLRSYDGGASWQAVSLTIPPEILPITAVAADPHDSNRIYAAAKNQLYSSDDNGDTWHGMVLPTKRTASIIVIDPENSNNMYIGLRN